jgi:arylsulfate sulfotransferase
MFAGCSSGGKSEAASAQIKFQATRPGGTPFIAFVDLQAAGLDRLASYAFSIQPKPRSVSAAVHVVYSSAALASRGYVPSQAGTATTLSVPIYGLYAGYANSVTIDLTFSDGSVATVPVTITTPSYSDPNATYDHATVVQQRAPGSALGFSYMALKSFYGTPVIIDTDAEIRWVGTGIATSQASIADHDSFIVGDTVAPALQRVGLDGSLASSPLSVPDATHFHHNIDVGRQGLLIHVATSSSIESVVAEVTSAGQALKVWDLGAILTRYMSASGDDPTQFVRPGIDWFHSNAATYDPRDGSVVISSRENFLIKLDYLTGDIIWIFGDPSKYWYTFPSLRAKALALVGGGLYPIGQHAVSITSDGRLMIFNDGYHSLNQPAGAAPGMTRTYSAVSAYEIDAATMTAREALDFDYGQSLYSAICSSVYEAAGYSYLIAYSYAENGTAARLVGLDANHNVAFDFSYPNVGCNTSWNAVPLALDNLQVP